MAENEPKSIHETAFTEQNILALKNHINRSINEYATEKGEDGKIDVFLIFASLAQSSYELAVRSLTQTQEEADLTTEQMKKLVGQYIVTVDQARKEARETVPLSPATELAAAAHLLGRAAEFFSFRRDQVVRKLHAEKMAAKQDEAADEKE